MIAAIRDWRRSANRFARMSQSPSLAASLSSRRLPLSLSQEARLRRVFGVSGDGPLPKVDEQSTLRYREYLAANLAFPFSAQFYDVFEGAVCDHFVTAVRLLGIVPATRCAPCSIECEILIGDAPLAVALTALRPCPQTANRQSIDDYHYWLRHGR